MNEFLLIWLKFLAAGIAIIVLGYVAFRVFGYAIFKSYFQAKNDNHLTQKEESNGPKT